MAKWWCLLARKNYMFWPIAAILGFNNFLLKEFYIICLITTRFRHII